MSNMFPSSWGNYGGNHQPQNFGGPAPRKQHPAGGQTAPAAGFGAAPAGGSALFSSLQEQHLQQMQQLQMLHQKQLESVLHHNSAAGSYGGGGGGAAGFSAPSWQSEASGHADNVFDGGQAFYNQQDEAQAQSTRGPEQARPPLPQTAGGKPNPPPSEAPPAGGPPSNDGPKSKEVHENIIIGCIC